jgi:hypothetical protein
MSVQQRRDITADINDNSIAQLDVGGWDYVVVQLVSPTGTFTFKTTNDADETTAVSDGSAISATNWIDVQGTVLSTGSGATTLAASGLIRFEKIGQFLQLSAPGAAQVTKAIVRFYKIC